MRRPGREAGGLPPSRPRVPADGAARGRAGAQRSHGGHGGPLPPRGPEGVRPLLRDNARRRHHDAHDGAAREGGGVGPQGHLHQGAAGLLPPARQAHVLRGERQAAHALRRVPDPRLCQRPHRRAPRRAGEGRHRRRQEHPLPRPQRVPDRRRVRLLPLRLRPAAGRGDAADRARGQGSAALHAPGGPRHRPHQQAQGLRAPGAGLRHRGRQREARLRPGPARVLDRRADTPRPRRAHHAPAHE